MSEISRKSAHSTKIAHVIVIGTDKNYMEALRKIWDKLDIDCPHYYVDWPENITKCHWKGANIGINNFLKKED